MSPLELERQCERYARLKLWLCAFEYLMLLSVLAGLALTGIAGQWHRVLTVTMGQPVWALFIYLAAIAVAARLALLPVQFASGYLVERRFGLSRQSALEWLSEWSVTTLLFGVPYLFLALPVVMHLQWWPALLLPVVGGLLALRILYYEWLFLPVLSLFYPVRFLRSECFHLPGLGRRSNGGARAEKSDSGSWRVHGGGRKIRDDRR